MKFDWFGLSGFELLFGEVFLHDDGLIDEFVEPGFAHDVVTAESDVIAPAVLDFPSVGFAIFDVDSGDDHGVVHGAMPVIEHLLFGELDAEIELGFVIEGLVIPSEELWIAIERDIASKPDRLTIGKLFDDEFLDALHRKVKVIDGLAFFDVAKVLDGVILHVWLIACWRIDEGLILVDSLADVLLEEGFRGEVFVDDIALLVLMFEIEFGRRDAEAVKEEMVDLFHDLLFHLSGGSDIAFFEEWRGICGEFPDCGVNQEVAFLGVFGLEGLWEFVLWDETILLDEVDEHIPLATVGDWHGEDEMKLLGNVELSC